jgi:protease-4
MSNTTEQNLGLELLKEKRRDRRWKNGRFFGWIILLLIYAFFLFGSSSEPSQAIKSGRYVSLVKLSGPIMPHSPNSADNLGRALQTAFRDKRSKGVVLLINSPGGAAVQSALIHDQILRLKKKYKKKVVVVGQDSLASGAYMIAAAADQIYVNASTVTGSIGVVMGGFGFTDIMKKVGVSRRLFTAGKYKGRMDPFEPLNATDKAKMQSVLDKIHHQFIDYVKVGRADRLDLHNKDLFTGDFWVGSDAVRLGLADHVGDLWEAMTDEFKVDHYRDYTPKHGILSKLMHGVSEELDLHLNESSFVQAELR